MADQANADLDESTLFLSALGGSSYGRVLGFGSLLEQKVQTATNRDRQNHIASSISGVRNNRVQENFSRAEVQMIVQERDRRIAEEQAERMRGQAQNQFLFSQLFRMYGLQKPTSQAPANSFDVPLDGLLGNMPNLQGQGPTSQQSSEVPLRLQMAMSQGMMPQ